MPIKLAFSLLLREWRAGELRILFSALCVAVTCLASIGFFTDRIERALQEQAAELLGSDLAITSPDPIPSHWPALARHHGLQTAETLTFPSVIAANAQVQLASVKAVSAPYPLLGELEIKTSDTEPTQKITHPPQPGTLWVEERLLNALALNVGDVINLGHAQFIIAAILVYEPDRGMNWLNLSPRVLINAVDIPQTGILQPGSRIEYRLLVTGPSAALEAFTHQLIPQLAPNQRIYRANEDENTFNHIVKRITYYLKIATLLNVALAGIAIASATQRYARRHFVTSGLLRCLGAQQNTVLGLFLLQIGGLALISCLIGSGLGYSLQYPLEHLLQQLTRLPLPSTRWQPMLAAIAAGFLVLFSFALPPLLRIKTVPPLHVLRQDALPAPLSAWLVYGLGIIGFSVLLLNYTRDLRLTGLLLAAGLVTYSLLSAAAYGLIRLTSLLRQRVGRAARYGLANLARHADASRLQILAFGFTFMAMWLLILVRTDLLVNWQEQLPPQTPNYFLFNITPDEVAAIQTQFQQHPIVTTHFYPMIRGRLFQLNGRPIHEVIDKKVHNHPSLNRELNLTWSHELPEGNAVTAGKWFASQAMPYTELSISEQLAEQLGIQLGDELGFQIAGQTITATVTSKRLINWQNFRPNFFIIFPPKILDDLPTTYITSFYLEPSQKSILNTLIQAFPNLTLIDVNQLLSQARTLITKASYAIEYLLVFTLLVGILILFATLYNNLDQRCYEGAILRALGISRYQLQTSLAAEFITLGALAGFLGSTSAACINYYLSHHLFNQSPAFNVWLWLSAPILGAALVGSIGWFATRPILQHSPIRILQEN